MVAQEYKQDSTISKGYLKAMKMRELDLTVVVEEEVAERPVEGFYISLGSPPPKPKPRKRKAESELEKEIRKKIGYKFQKRTDMHWFDKLVGKPPKIKLAAPVLKHCRRLQMIMRDNQFDREVQNLSRGKLDYTKLYKVPTGSTKVFKKKMEPKNKEYHFGFLLDASSSMRGGRGKGVLRCLEVLSALLRKVPGIHQYYSAFSESCFSISTPWAPQSLEGVKARYVATLYSRYSARAINEHMADSNYGVKKFTQKGTGPWMGGTAVIEAISETIKLFPRGVAKKYMFVLCDGDTNEDEGSTRLKDLERLAKKNNIHLIGVGIGVKSVKDVYEHSIVVKSNGSDLAEQMVQLISKLVKRN